MIKRLRVKNFRSLKDVDLTLGLNNVLVGPNASGKSNFLDVFRFLTHVGLVGLNRAFTDRLGFPEVVWKGQETGPIHILLDIEITEAGVQYILEYEIEVD